MVRDDMEGRDGGFSGGYVAMRLDCRLKNRRGARNAAADEE